MTSPNANPNPTRVALSEAEQLNTPWVRALATKLVHDGQAADDVVQDAWIAAWRSGPSDAASLSNWLAAVVARLAGKRARAESNRAARERIAARAEAVEAPDEIVGRAEAHRVLVEAVLALDEPYRSTILLRFLDERTPAEIATRQSVPVSTVKTRLARGLAQLRERLDRMHRGDRSSWLTALAPLAHPGSAAKVTLGAVLVKTKVVVAACVVLALGWFAVVELRPSKPVALTQDSAPTSSEDVDASARVSSPSESDHAPGDRPNRGESGARAAMVRSIEIVGHVVDRDSGAGVPGFSVSVFGKAERVTTPADGSFAIGFATEADAVVVHAVPPAGWSIDGGDIEVDLAAHRRGALDPIEFRAHRADVHVVSAVLVDEITREHVPEFVVRTTFAGEGARDAISDRDGRIELVTQSSAATTCDVQCIDVSALASAWARVMPVRVSTADFAASGTSAKPCEIAVRVGPTYQVEVELPGGTNESDFVATLEGASRFSTTTLPADVTPLRAGMPRWVRFGPLQSPPAGGPPWNLCLEARAQQWFGRATVESITGIRAEPVAIALRRCARVRVDVGSSSGQPLPAAMASETAVESGPDSNVGDERVIRPVDADGRVTFDRLRPGSFVVDVWCAGFERTRREIELRPGDDVQLEFALRDATALGSVSGELRSKTGTYAMPTEVVLYGAKGATRIQKVVEWIADGSRNTAPFQFDDVPVGDYVLSIFPGGGFPWDHEDLPCPCPSEGNVFTCQDDAVVEPVVLRLFDAESGTELPSVWSHHETWIDNGRVNTSTLGPLRSGAGIAFVVPGRTHVRWIVGAPGYAPKEGDETAFTRTAKDDGSLELDVRLDRGWGMNLVVLRGGSADPIAGVAVKLDDVDAGRTDAKGLVRLRAPQRPKHVVIEHADWILVDGDIGATGALTDSFLVHDRVWMRAR